MSDFQLKYNTVISINGNEKIARNATAVTTTGAGHSLAVNTGLNTVVSAVANLTTAPSTGGAAPANCTAILSTDPGYIILNCYTYLYTATTSTSSVTANWIAVGS